MKPLSLPRQLDPDTVAVAAVHPWAAPRQVGPELMTKEKPTISRETADQRFARTQKVATEETQNELAAIRKKTARLKALREQKETGKKGQR